jgi:hypothetical protein
VHGSSTTFKTLLKTYRSCCCGIRVPWLALGSMAIASVGCGDHQLLDRTWMPEIARRERVLACV